MVPDEVSKKSFLFFLQRFDVVEVFFVQPVDLVIGHRFISQVPNIGGEQFFRDNVPVLQVNDAVCESAVGGIRSHALSIRRTEQSRHSGD
ncbi:MAG: hypothetical protein IH899_18760 [Planctomycetes bacterium]|nr:hypothetical protein [Planctomycetota bacterium]